MSLQVWLPLLGNTKNQGLLNLTMTGSPASYGTGPLGQSATFTGSTANVIYNDSNLTVQYTDNFSWCTWIKTNFTGTTAQYAFTVGRADAGGLGYGLQCNSTTNCIVRFGNKQYNLAVTGGEWTHIAFTKQGTSLKVYKNGVLASTYTFDGTLPTYSDGKGLGLGCFHYTGNIYPFYGSLCDFRIYDHVLSAKEVKEISKGLCLHYQLKGTGTNPNLVKNSHDLSGTDGYLADENGYRVGYHIGNGSTWRESYPETGISAVGNTLNGTQITISCDIKTDDITKLPYMYIGLGTFLSTGSRKGDVNHELSSYTVLTGTKTNNQWFRVYKTITVPTTWTTEADVYKAQVKVSPTAGTATLWFRKLKLEKGDKATPWCPNSVDTLYNALGYENIIGEDYSGYARNAVVTNCSYDSDSPRYTGSVRFNSASDKFILNSHLSNGQQLTEFTTAIWAKTNTLNSTAPNIISLGQNSFWRFRIQSATSVWYYIRVGSTQVQSTYTTKTLTDNIWHHYALTFKDGIVRLYIDGAQVGTTDHSATAKYITCASTNWILHSYDGTNEAFVGSLSDCRIYGTCLSADDVKKLYDTPIAIDNTGKLFCNNLVEE